MAVSCAMFIWISCIVAIIVFVTGLGGKGGPYRLDKGHDVHQLSDEVGSKLQN